jgi:large subunit ribosomal protein L14e
MDSPTTGVPRWAFPYHHLTLTPLTVPKHPRGTSSGIVKKCVEKAEVVAKWESTLWAKKRAVAEKLTDFERFQVMLYKKVTAR